MNNSNLSVYAQLPQYIGFSVADIFGTLATFEFAYLIAPRSAQSFFMSLYFISRSIVSYILIGYENTVSKYFQCHTNKSWLSYAYFYILAVIQIIFLIIFIICQKYYRMIKLNRQEIERNQFLQPSLTESPH
jgi:dipeptide/tripeptide permease